MTRACVCTGTPGRRRETARGSAISGAGSELSSNVRGPGQRVAAGDRRVDRRGGGGGGPATAGSPGTAPLLASAFRGGSRPHAGGSGAGVLLRELPSSSVGWQPELLAVPCG